MNKFKVGDRIDYKGYYTGTILKIDDNTYHIKRDDGIEGVGIGSSWLVGSESKVYFRKIHINWRKILGFDTDKDN